MDAAKKNLSHKQIMRSPEVCLSVLTVGVLVASIAELCLGPQSYSLAQLWNAFAQQSATDPVWRVLAYVRIPRLLAGLLAGAALAVAGTLLQAVLNNAMASPNVIGVNSGAGFFALLAAALAPEALGAAQFVSFLGALGCAMLVYGLARLTGLSRTTLVLSGLAVSGMFSAGINIIRQLWPESISSAPNFLVGGLSGATLKMLLLALPYLFTGAILAFWIDTDLNVLCLGDETASSLGLNVETIRFIGILAAALLAGAAVSFAGLLSFVGLLAPHIARKFVGNDHRILLPASALLGAFCVVGCDLPARLLFAPFELPVGILLSLIGGPFFLGLLLRHKGGRLYA